MKIVASIKDRRSKKSVRIFPFARQTYVLIKSCPDAAADLRFGHICTVKKDELAR
jgi:hypothetical protein